MTKAYVKPQILYEDFELAENIAACELISSTYARYSCPVYDTDTGWTIFQEGTGSGCVQTPADGEQICYEVPFEDYNVFVS